MRYEDASHTAFQGNEPIARDDSDALPAGTRGPATGNLISGAGTQTGSAGADQAAGAHITSIAGKGGEDASFAAGKLSVMGEYGKLSVDADGNYSYMANAGTPENVRDRFSYTLADSAGNSDSALLLIEIGKTPAVIKANAQQIVPGPDGVVTLPPGVSLADVHIVGRNLVIDLPDGTQLVIVDGAVFVPQLVLDGVEVPATNLAALLIGQEPQPAAGDGPVQSSGGPEPFPVPPLDPGVPLGDLIPPTEYDYIPPEPEEVFDILDEEPEAGVTSAQLDDDAQDDGNPGGTGDDPGTDVASGSLPGSGGDGSLEWGLLASGNLPAGFSFAAQPNGDVWIMQGATHVLTVSVDPTNGDYTVTQVAAIDHPAGGDENNLDFTIDFTVTDDDGDVAIGQLNINVDDDTPIAVVEGQVLGLVDEDDLPSGNNDTADGDDDPGNADGDNDGTTTAGAAGSLLGLFSFGADQPGTSGLGTDTSGMTAQGLTSNGVALTYVVAGDTLTASAGGETIFTLTVNADGSWSFDLEGQLDHDVADTEDNLDIDFSSMIVATDHDGDTATLPDDTFVVTVDDDLPVTVGEGRVTGLVDEDDLPAGNHDDADGDDDPGNADGDNDGTTTGGDAGSLSSLFSFGADQPGTVELSSDTSGLPALTSGGVPVTYSVQGNVLTASAGGSTVFTLTVNPNGSWVFDLQGQLDHSVAGTEDNLLLDFSSIIIGVDADGDTATLPPESFVVDVDDDMPQEFEDCPDDVITVNEPGTIVEGNLNLPPVGADDPGVVSFGVADGDPVVDTGGDPVTANGQPLLYFINDDGVLEARVGDETGEVIFTITLNDDGTYTYEQVGSLGEGGQIEFEDLTSASAGNVEFRGVGADDAATTVDLLLSAGPADGSTVNTDSNSIGSANQSMDNGETVRIDLVSNLTTGAATPSGFGYSGHVSSNSFVQLIPQVQGSQDQTTALTVWALNTSDTQADESDRDPTGGFANSSITSVTEVTVKDYLTGESTTLAVSFTDGTTFVNVAYGISVRVNADGSVTFSGIQQGDSYGINTGAGEFNAVVVQAEPAGTGGSTQDSFDLGIFSIGVANEFEPVDLSIPIILTDADGDPVECDLDIHIGPPLEANDVNVTVNEAGLPLIGSDEGSNSEIQSGDLNDAISGGTGPYSFALQGSGNGTYGTLVVDPVTGAYTYTLDTPFDSQPDADDGTNPELAAESFQVVATDSLGATQTITVNINIIDDVPTAEDDTDSIEDGGSTATGNLITDASAGDAGDSDNGADTKGADNATVSAVASDNVPANSDSDPAGGGFVVVGEFGTLTVQPDGSYSYVRADGAPGAFQDVFTYTLTDGDGDTSTATLTIDIEDAPTTLDVPTQGEAGTLVDEQGLPTRNGGEPAGTGEAADGNSADNDDTSETTAGVINFTAPDGPATVTIDGVVVTGVAGQTFNGAHGVLTITSYDAVTGQIGYSYTLTDNTSGDATFDDFAVVVTDNDGDSSNATLVINIIDDTPIAVDDTDSIAAGQYGPATGNVVTDAEGDGGKDNVGADNAVVVGVAAGDTNANLESPATVGAVIQGAYGKLTLNTDGSYSYTRDPGTDGGVQDVFTYTIEDGDGDQTNATLTIDIADSPVTIDGPDEGEAGTVVDEKGLPARTGEPEGSGEHAAAGANGDTSETTAGTINFSAPDGPAIVRIDGVVVTGPGQTFVGDHGTLTITSYNAGTGQIGYSYTLADNTSGDATFDDFALQVEDQDGDIANDTLTIDIIDDEPAANDDSDTVDNLTDQAIGNVITGSGTAEGTGNADYPGADDFDSITGLVSDDTADSDTDPTGGFDVTGQYGTLHMNADGSYTYTRDPGSPGAVSESFTYTYVDGDGDEATAVLTISIADDVPVLPNEPDVNLDDDVVPGLNGNPDGTGDDDPDVVGENDFSGTLVGAGGDGDLDYFFSLTQPGLPAGFTVDPSSTATHMIILQNGNPVLTIDLNNESGAYTVTQTAAITHPDGGNENNVPNITVSFFAQDLDGSQSAPGTMTINVDDDTPTVDVVKGTSAEPVLTTDDAETIGGDSDDASSSANFGGLFSLNQSAGADGAAAAATLQYALDVTGYSGGPAGVNSGLESHDADIFLYEIGGEVVGSTSATLAGVNAGNTVFDVSVDGNGVVTLTQHQQIDHDTVDPSPTGGPDYDDHIVSLSDDLVTLTASASLTDNDNDTATNSEVVNIGANLRFTDDGPNAEVDAQQDVPTLTLDETRPEGGDEGGPNVTTGLASVTVGFAGNFLAADYGADGAGTTTYALILSADGAASGLYALENSDTDDGGDGDGYGQGDEILLFQEADGSVTGRTTDGGPVYFTISVDENTGEVTFEQSDNVWHSDAADDDDTSALSAAAETLQLEQTVTDFDGDTDTASIDLSDGVFAIEDDGPEIIEATDAQGDNTGPTPTAEGIFDFDIGTDSPNGGNKDIDVSNFMVSINGGTPFAPDTFSETSEDAATAEYEFTFEYDVGNGDTAIGEGTLVFDKAAGTYTVTLNSGPIEGFSIVSTATGADPVFYNNEHIGIVEVADGLFMQFTGFSAATGSNGPMGDGDVFIGTDDNVHISSTEIGVHGNALQDSEVVDFEFMTSDPGAIDAAPSATAATAFIQLGQFNSSNPEDVILVLKLADPNDPDNFVTRTLVVNGDDILDNQADIPAGFPTLGTNEAMIIVSPEDYASLVPAGYEIAGMQIRSSSEGLASEPGEVYNFDGDVGVSDTSATSFGASTNDNDVLKIVNIGAVVESTEDQSATFDFDVTVTDADGDSETTSLSATIGDPPADTLAATSFSADSEEQQVQKSAANSNTVTMAAAVAAAGMAESAAAAPADDQSFQLQSDGDQSYSTQVVSRQVADDGQSDSSAIAALPEAQEAEAEASKSSSRSQGDEHRADASIDAASSHQAGNDHSADQPANDQGPASAADAQIAAAPAVMMVSAEALKAAVLEGKGHPNGEHGNAVEQVVAEALGHGAAPTVDSLLAGLGNGEVGALHALASPAFDNAPAWDMGQHGSFASAADMIMKVGADMAHHDAVQPAVNG